MKVEEYYEKKCCTNCEKYTYVHNIVLSDGTIVLSLCKECLLKLLKGLIER